MSESIYNLVPSPYVEPVKAPMYRSKYDPKAPLTSSTFGLHGTTATIGGGVNELKKSHVLSSTFGPTDAEPRSPKKFLTAGSKTGALPPPDPSAPPFERPLPKDSRKATVPTRADKPIMGLRTSKNFITANAVAAILAVPQMPRDESVEYLKKEDYGRVPGYLKQVREEIARENEMIDEYVKKKMSSEQEENGDMYAEMDEQERQDLINKLKTKWDAVNHTYQKICHRTKFESRGDINRKEGQEAELKRLENDIMLLQRSGPVCIQD